MAKHLPLFWLFIKDFGWPTKSTSYSSNFDDSSFGVNVHMSVQELNLRAFKRSVIS